MASSRLRYQVVRCTSEDPEYPVSELLAHSSQTRGWQTARFCEFPQEIGLQFEGPVHLRQVQFLSHQSKIATKIELFTGVAPEGCLDARYETVQFKRLGYLSLDNNERSQFQARELKSVYVDVSAQFLRILLHKCHANRHNVVNQVGLVALNCLGEALGSQPGLALAPPASPPAASASPPPQRAPSGHRSASPAASPQQQNVVPFSGRGQRLPGEARGLHAEADASAARPAEPQRRPQQPQPQAAAEPPAQQRPPPVAPPCEEGLDERTSEQVRELLEAKRAAVDNEDFDEAKRCKEVIDRLRKTGVKLRELEEQKKAAIASEDYDTAKFLKAEMDRLRCAAENPQAPPLRPPSAPAPGHAEHEAEHEEEPGRTALAPGGRRGAARAPAAGAGRPPRREASPAGDDPPGHEGAAEPSPGAPPPFADYRQGHEGGYPAGAAAHAALPADPSPRGPPPREGTGPPQGRGARLGSTPAPIGEEAAPEEAAPLSPAAEERAPLDPSHPLAGVPNFEDLREMEPEPLAGKAAEVAGGLQGVCGEYLTRCVLSKTWNLRDAALQRLALDLRQGAFASMRPAELLRGLVAVLLQTVPDRSVQVFASSAALLQAVCQTLPLQRPEAQAALEPLLPALADRLADANARAIKTAADAHVDLARCPAVGAPFATRLLLQQPKKKMNPKGYSSRLQLLASLVQEAGVQPDSREGVPLEPAMQLAMEWFGNPAADVRDSAVRLVGACFARVGLGRVERHLASLKPAQREKFDAEFERVSGDGRAASRSPRTSPTGRGRGATPLGGPSGGGGRGAPGHFEAAMENYGDLPAPQVPPPRSGSGQRQRPAAGGGPAEARARDAAASPPPPRAAELYDEEEGSEEGDVPEFTCHFCGRQDPSFTPEALDLHYWRECPMLIQCQLCEQVIEIAKMYSHLCEECEAGGRARAAARGMLPDECPLCRAQLGACEEADWMAHLLDDGCARNPRDRRSGAAADCPGS